jgi:hypothetical protein
MPIFLRSRALDRSQKENSTTVVVGAVRAEREAEEEGAHNFVPDTRRQRLRFRCAAAAAPTGMYGGRGALNSSQRVRHNNNR